MSDPRISSYHQDAEKIVHHLQTEFSTLQTGRANASLVEHLNVEAYGQKMNLKGVASVSVQDARTIVIQPWDKSTLGAIEKAIQLSEMGVNPVNDGIVIRISLPAMTEERRKELVKIVQKLSEEARISVRQARQKALDAIKQDPNETLRASMEKQLQAEVDKSNGKIDELRKQKEEEVMKV